MPGLNAGNMLWGAQGIIGRDLRDECDAMEIARTYSLAQQLRWNLTDWEKIDGMISDKWGMNGLAKVRKLATTGKCWEPSP